MDEIAAETAVDESTLASTLAAVIRCPFGTCQSFDTALLESTGRGFEHHQCQRCDRGFTIQREGDGYTYLGWYGE